MTLHTEVRPEAAGPKKRSAGTWLGYGVIGLFVAVCMAGWAVVMGHAGPSATGVHGISARTIAFTVRGDESVQLSFQLLKPADAEVACTAQAQAKDGMIVGQQKVVVGPGKSTSTHMLILPTTGRATTAEVRDCARS